MALVQPTNLFPSSFRGSGGDVIDASVSNTFSLQLNGSSACTGYNLSIMQNDAASTSVYTTGNVTLATPIYPRDYNNDPQRLEVTIPSSSGMVNGYANGYKWNITLYWNSGANSIITQDTVFLAQASPYFQITNDPFTLDTKQLSLNATYTQTDDVPLEWYRWVLLDSNGNVVADTGEIYSEDIQFHVDGLLDGETFTYIITGQTQSGVPVGGIINADWGRLYDVDNAYLSCGHAYPKRYIFTHRKRRQCRIQYRKRRSDGSFCGRNAYMERTSRCGDGNALHLQRKHRVRQYDNRQPCRIKRYCHIFVQRADNPRRGYW